MDIYGAISIAMSLMGDCLRDTLKGRREGRLFIDFSGPFHETSLGGMRFVMLCVDVFSMYEFVRFLRKKSDATEGLRP